MADKVSNNGSNGKLKELLGRKKARRLLFYILMMAFPVAQFMVFYVALNFRSILLAFQSVVNVEGTYRSSFSLTNFQTIFYEIFHYPQNAQFLKLLKNSLIAFGLEILVKIPLGVLFSYYIYKKRFLGNAFKVILFTTSIMNVLSLVIVFRSVADKAIPSIFGVEPLFLQLYPNRIFWSVAVFGLWISFGVNILMYVGAMNGIDPSIVEAARIDGTGYFSEFIFITIPMCYKTITVFVVVSVAGIFTNQMYLHHFFGWNASPEVQTFGYYLFKLAGQTNSETSYGYASAWGLLMTVVVVPITLVLRKLFDKYGPSED